MSVPANNDEPLVRIAEDDFAKAVSLRAILAASLPSIVNNAAQPIAAALQLGLLGHSDSAAQRVAVFSAVGAAVTFVANISNFVIVVTMSGILWILHSIRSTIASSQRSPFSPALMAAL